MMKKVLIAIAAVVILAVGGWVIYDKTKSKDTADTTVTKQASSTTQEATDQKAAASTIDIKNMMFTPPQITVNKGDTVTWTNNDTVAHTVVDDLSNVGGPASGTIEPGSSYSFTFEKTGSFQYHCSFHTSMRGTIVVK